MPSQRNHAVSVVLGLKKAIWTCIHQRPEENSITTLRNQVADQNASTKYGKHGNFIIRNKYILESVQQHAMGPELTTKTIQIRIGTSRLL